MFRKLFRNCCDNNYHLLRAQCGTLLLVLCLYDSLLQMGELTNAGILILSQEAQLVGGKLGFESRFLISVFLTAASIINEKKKRNSANK